MKQLLYIDLFCGAGGTSTGVNSARLHDEQCAEVIACVNHDPKAIASHAANHPGALHFTEDIRTLELSPLVEHIRKCREQNPGAHTVLWASLECTNFSKAKGGQPRDADSRTLAEHLFRYIDAIAPDYIQIENVEEFMSWGSLDENGKPLSKDRGRCYVRWVNRIKRYGYDFDFRMLNAADYGAFTSRKRFFGIFAKAGLPIVFPRQTHSKKGENTLFGALRPWKPVREVLDLDDEGNSIFDRKKPLAEKTLERIHAGLVKFVAGGKEAFMLKYNSMSKKGKYIPPALDEPCPTVATQGRLGLVTVSFLSKQFSGQPDCKNSSIDVPAGTITCIDHHAFVSVHYGNGFNISCQTTAPTVTTHDKMALVKVKHFIASEYSGGGQVTSIEAPNPAVLTNPKQKVVAVKTWIMDTNFSNVGSSLDEPSRVITANHKQHYLMQPQFAADCPINDIPSFIRLTDAGDIAIEIYETDSPMTVAIKKFMALYGIIDITMRMLKILELKLIMGFPKDYVLVGTQADQKKFIGNAVEVTIARKWCEALCDELQRRKPGASPASQSKSIA